MRIEQKSGLTWLYPDDQKIIVKAGQEDGERYSSLVLSRSDSPDNYMEIDVLTPDVVPDPVEQSIELLPDPDGRISYEDAKKLLDTITVMQERVVALQENSDILTECILEMSQVVYNV